MVASNNIFEQIFQVLKTVSWPDLDRDTVLNVWLLRSRHHAPGRLDWSWARLSVDAQGDDASEAALGAAVEQRLRQCLPRGITGVTFRLGLRAGGVADSLFHGKAYAWEVERADELIEALNSALLPVLQQVEWPRLSDSTVLNCTLVREAPSVGEASLKCEWPALSADAQGDDAAESVMTSEGLAERLVAALPEGVSAAEFRIELSEEGSLQGLPFHVSAYRWRRITQDGSVGDAEP